MNSKVFTHILSVMVMMCCSVSLYAEAVWIDVRTLIEHKIDNIEGDIRIPHSEIVAKVNDILPDKTTEIRLYCRSGVRSGKAVAALKANGYTNVFNAGGIDSARKERGLEQ